MNKINKLKTLFNESEVIRKIMFKDIDIKVTYWNMLVKQLDLDKPELIKATQYKGMYKLVGEQYHIFVSEIPTEHDGYYHFDKLLIGDSLFTADKSTTAITSKMLNTILNQIKENSIYDKVLTFDTHEIELNKF